MDDISNFYKDDVICCIKIENILYVIKMGHIEYNQSPKSKNRLKEKNADRGKNGRYVEFVIKQDRKQKVSCI